MAYLLVTSDSIISQISPAAKPTILKACIESSKANGEDEYLEQRLDAGFTPTEADADYAERVDKEAFLMLQCRLLNCL